MDMMSASDESSVESNCSSSENSAISNSDNNDNHQPLPTSNADAGGNREDDATHLQLVVVQALVQKRKGS